MAEPVDYSETLNLPRTEFPMRANLVKREPNLLEFWRENRIYYKALEKRANSQYFILHDGPPYSNGRIHMGQAWNKILKDFVVKFRTLQGYYSPFVPGWDTHGLPNELATIKTYNIDRKTVSPVDLRKKCKELAVSFSEIQKHQFIRLGVFGDWDNPYLTLDPSYEAAVIRIFKELAKKGYIYRGLKPVFWCVHCETSLAEAEIEYKDKVSPSIFVMFPIKNAEFEGIEHGSKVYALVWTTTPWTLPANVAIAYNPSEKYLLVRSTQGYLIIGRTAYNNNPVLSKLVSELNMEIIRELGAQELANLTGVNPLVDRDSKLIPEDYVALEEGTGLVHTAPGHGEEDHKSALKYDLPILVGVDEHGYMTEVAGEFQGKHVTEVDDIIIQRLREKGLLLHATTITHSYPHCWRCKSPVIFRAAKQWFLSVDHDNLRQKLLEEIERVKWYPEWGQNRIRAMVQVRPDWNLSRQRVWGIPIPVFYCESCGKEILDENVITHLEGIFSKEGADSWWKRTVEELLPEGYKCPHCGATEFRKGNDIFDVWFESAVSHSAVLRTRPNLKWPSNLYLEGNDQHRGWFQVSLITGVAAYGRAPYDEVVTHGWVLDKDGRTMHKSLGNVIDPMDVVEQFGADVLRLYFSSLDYRGDIKFSMDGLKGTVEIYKKWRNTLRFMLGNLFDFELSDIRTLDSAPLLDRYAIYRLNKLIGDVTSYFESYEFHKVFQEIHNYIVRFLSPVYLDVRKDVLYTFLPDSDERRITQTVIYHTLLSLLKLLFPILSFTTEEAWQLLVPKYSLPMSVYLSDWPKALDVKLTEKELELIERAISLRDKVNDRLEVAKNRKLIAKPAEARVYLLHKELDLNELTGLLKELLMVADLKLERHPQAELYDDLWIYIENSGYLKCQRCWRYYPKLSDRYDGLCERCADIYDELKKVKLGRV